MAVSYILKSSIKLGAVGGATYATINHGLWGTSQQSREGYDKIINSIPSFPSSLPYLDKIKINIPIQDYKKYTLKECWNSGVQYAFYGLSILPCKTSHYISIGWNKVNQAITNATN